MRPKWMLKSMDTEKRGPKTCQNRQNITKTVTKINPKSIKIEIRFLDRFWGGPGGGCQTPRSSLLGAIFDQKSPKRHEKRHAKFDIEKVSKINAKRLPK